MLVPGSGCKLPKQLIACERIGLRPSGLPSSGKAKTWKNDGRLSQVEMQDVWSRSLTRMPKALAIKAIVYDLAAEKTQYNPRESQLFGSTTGVGFLT